MASNYKELIKQYYKRFPSAKVQDIDNWLRRNHPQEYKQYQYAIRQAMSGENIRQPQTNKPTVPQEAPNKTTPNGNKPTATPPNKNIGSVYDNAKSMEDALAEQGLTNTKKPSGTPKPKINIPKTIKGAGGLIGKGNAILGTGLTALEVPSFIQNMTSPDVTLAEKALNTFGMLGGIPTGGITAGATNQALRDARETRELLKNDSLKDRELYNDIVNAGLLKEFTQPKQVTPQEPVVNPTPVRIQPQTSEPQLSPTPNMGVEQFIRNNATTTESYVDAPQSSGTPVNLSLGINSQEPTQNAPRTVQPSQNVRVNNNAGMQPIMNNNTTNLNNMEAASNIGLANQIMNRQIGDVGNINNRYEGVNPMAVQAYINAMGLINQALQVNPDELKAAQERDRRAKQLAGVIDFANSYRPREQTLSGITMFGMYPNAEQFRSIGGQQTPFLSRYQSAEAELLARQKAAYEQQQQQITRQMEAARIVNAVDMAEQFQIPLGLAMSMQDDPKAAANIITNNENARIKLGEEGLKNILGYLGRAAENNAAYRQAIDETNLKAQADRDVANINQMGGLAREQQAGINSQAIQGLKNQADLAIAQLNNMNRMQVAQMNNDAAMDLERLRQQSPEVYARLVNSYNGIVQNGIYFNDPTARNLYQQYAPILTKELGVQMGVMPQNTQQQAVPQQQTNTNAMLQWMNNKFNQ